MRINRLLALCMLMSLSLLAACGSGSDSTTHTAPSTPVFTSVPITAATQNVAYTYQLAATDPAGGSVTFALTSSPTGASLSGSTVSWTPTAAESRVSNSFVVTATTTSGGTQTQSWTVTPGGTITVNWVNTYWTASGPAQVQQQPSAATNISAMWTNADGSITVEKSSATSPGVFTIPNVPAGYYWLTSGSNEYWTSTGTFDAGSDISGPLPPRDSDAQITSFQFSLSGLDSSIAQPSWVAFLFPVQGLPGSTMTDPANSSTLTPGFGIGTSGIDWTQVHSAYLMQYKPVSLNSSASQINNQALDYWLDPSLTLVNDAINTIVETLEPATPQESLNLNVAGSQWASLFTISNAPATPVPYSSAFAISAEPYMTGGSLPSATTASISPLVGIGIVFPPLILAGTEYVPPPIGGIGFTEGGPIFASCNGTGFVTANGISASQPAITTDQNFGTLQYADPFPVAWTRALSLCQEATIPVPIPNSTSSTNFLVVDSATVAPSNAPLAPAVLPVQNPTINGSASLFGATTLNSNTVTLNWSAPSSTAPFGYTVRAYVQTATGGVATYAATGAAFSTAQTSITLPPLDGGNTYVFSITALADGTANMETAPFRSSLPTGSATVISGPITISSTAQMPAIHGDRKVIERFSQPQSAGKGD